jgi:hypothetical protein
MAVADVAESDDTASTANSLALLPLARTVNDNARMLRKRLADLLIFIWTTSGFAC